MKKNNPIAFKPNFNVEILDSGRVVLFSEDQHHLLVGPLYAEIANMLRDGPQDETVVLATLSKKYSIKCACEALSRLKRKGFLGTYVENVSLNNTAFWSDTNLTPDGLEYKTAIIKNFIYNDISYLINSLKSLGVSVNYDGDFYVVVVDNYINNDMEVFNKERLIDRKPWIMVKPTGRIIKSCPKKYFYDEGERSCSIDETYQNLGGVVSPLTGIVAAIRHSVVNNEHVCYTVRNLPLPTYSNLLISM